MEEVGTCTSKTYLLNLLLKILESIYRKIILKMHLILHYELAQMITTKSLVPFKSFSAKPVLLNAFPSSRGTLKFTNFVFCEHLQFCHV